MKATRKLFWFGKCLLSLRLGDGGLASSCPLDSPGAAADRWADKFVGVVDSASEAVRRSFLQKLGDLMQKKKILRT